MNFRIVTSGISPHLGISPAGYGGGIYDGYYNHYSSYPPHTSFNFTQPNPYPPSHHHQSAQPNPYSPPQYNNSTTLINGHLMSQQFPSSHPHAQARQPPAYSQPIYQYSHPLGYYQPPPPQQNSATMVVNGHLLPNQFLGASQTHAQFSPTPYHSPPLNPNLEVPLPMISQSQSHESSSASVYSQFIPTKAMTTQAIYHSAPSPLACEQPQTIPLENGRVLNWENPESMAQQKGSGKLVSSQQQGAYQLSHKEPIDAKICELRESLKRSTEAFLSEFKEQMRLLRGSWQSPESRVDNLQKSASTVVPSESISAATEALPSLSPANNGNICKPHVDSCLNMHHVAGCVFGIDKREYNERMLVNSGNGREYNELELERVVVKQDIQIPNSGKQGREPDERYLFDKMPKSNGLCNASSGKGLILASDGKPQSRGLFQAVRFKKNGLATCCEIMDAIQDHALNLFDKMPKSDGLYDAGRINSSLTSIHDKEDKSEEWNVDSYLDAEIATLTSWSYSDNSERVDGTIVTGSDDDVVTHEGGSVKKIFNSSASVALSKAATCTCSLVNDSITLFSRLEHYIESSKKVKHFVLQLCFSGFDKKVCDKGGGNPLFTHEYSIMYKELVGTRRLVLVPNFTYAIGCSETITDSMKSNEKFVRFVLCTLDTVRYVLCTLDAPYTIQKLELKLNYQNVLQVFSSYVSVFVTGEASTSLELLQNENKIDQVYGKAIEWILSSGMRVRYKSTSFSYGDLSELVATEYFSCSMRPTFTRELILYGYRSSVLMYKLVHKRVEVSVLLGAYTRDFNFNDNSCDRRKFTVHHSERSVMQHLRLQKELSCINDTFFIGDDRYVPALLFGFHISNNLVIGSLNLHGHEYTIITILGIEKSMRIIGVEVCSSHQPLAFIELGIEGAWLYFQIFVPSFILELTNGYWQLQLLLSYVIMLELGEPFTTWELLHTRGGYSERESPGVLTKTKEICVEHLLFLHIIFLVFGSSTSADDTHFCSHDLGDDSHAALHGSDTTICGLLDTSATAFGMALQPVHIVDYSLGTSFLLLLLGALFMSVRNLNAVIATAFAQLILRFTGTTMIMGQLVSGDISHESLESVQISTQNVKLEDKFLLRG